LEEESMSDTQPEDAQAAEDLERALQELEEQQQQTAQDLEAKEREAVERRQEASTLRSSLQKQRRKRERLEIETSSGANRRRGSIAEGINLHDSGRYPYWQGA